MRAPSPPTAVALLERALTYAGEALDAARTCPGDAPTPCSGWDFAALLEHLEASLETLVEAGSGYIGPSRSRVVPPTVDRLGQLLDTVGATWSARVTSAPVTVDDLPLGRDPLLLVGALEVAVHGWDVARAAGQDLPLPDELARPLLDVARAVVTREERGHRFAPAYVVPPASSPGVLLLAHLGRR